MYEYTLLGKFENNRFQKRKKRGAKKGI